MGKMMKGVTSAAATMPEAVAASGAVSAPAGADVGARAAKGAAANCVVADDGFFFGVGAFETVALEQGVPLFFSEHIARLMATLERLGIPVAREELVALAREACESDLIQAAPASHDLRRRVLKLTVTKENRLATLRDNTYNENALNRGFSCEFSEVRRNETSPLTAMKTLNYSDCILQKRAFVARGIDEPLFLNTKGQVAEGATTNVFAVIDGVVVTPPVSSGLLPGVMRGFVLQTLREAWNSREQMRQQARAASTLPVGAAKESFGWQRTGQMQEVIADALPVEERVILPEELERASEIFLTNSLMGAMPVRSLGKHTFACGTVAAKINEAYQEHVRATRSRWSKQEDSWA